jgi:hypothetical protein
VREVFSFKFSVKQRPTLLWNPRVPNVALNTYNLELKRVIRDQISAMRKQRKDTAERRKTLRFTEKRNPRAQTGVSVPQGTQRRGRGTITQRSQR